MSDRLTCLVPGCRRSTGRTHDEWICGKHWRLAPRGDRRAMAGIARRYRRQFGDQGYWTYPPGSDQRIAAVELDREWRRLWAQIKEAVIAENFMGHAA